MSFHSYANSPFWWHVLVCTGLLNGPSHLQVATFSFQSRAFYFLCGYFCLSFSRIITNGHWPYLSARTFRVEFNTPDTVAEFRDMFAEGKVKLSLSTFPSFLFNATFSQCLINASISFSTFPKILLLVNLFSIRSWLSNQRSSRQSVTRILPSSTMAR